jgi:uracil-DNA glycosylase
MGLSFSVPEGVKVPSSLVNIFKELKQDLGCSVPSHGNLEKWAVQVTIDMENIICFNFLFTKIGQMVLKYV